MPRRRPAAERGEPALAARSNRVRIIAGQWRGRRLSFPDAPGLRPSPDRVRETLFNWLMPVIAGARCLDLFAGSGALGFEAASRGAAHVDLVDSGPAVVAALRDNAALLAADAVQVHRQDALAFLARASGPYDVVFLDPPFRDAALLEQSMAALSGRLADAARIYIETPAKAPEPALPSGWERDRDKRAGQVACRLYRYRAGG